MSKAKLIFVLLLICKLFKLGVIIRNSDRTFVFKGDLLLLLLSCDLLKYLKLFTYVTY